MPRSPQRKPRRFLAGTVIFLDQEEGGQATRRAEGPIVTALDRCHERQRVSRRNLLLRNAGKRRRRPSITTAERHPAPRGAAQSPILFTTTCVRHRPAAPLPRIRRHPHRAASASPPSGNSRSPRAARIHRTLQCHLQRSTETATRRRNPRIDFAIPQLSPINRTAEVHNPCDT